MFVSLVGTWIQTVSQSWLVFQLTNSAFLLGVVGFLGAIPVFLLSLFAGVLADRANKRNILIFTQSAFMLLAFLLAVLTHLRLIAPWQIMSIALLNGVVMAFDAPSRQAVVVELVGKKHLLNAITLNSVAFNASRIIGPALAGILVALIGMAGCFYVNGISFLAMLAALFMIRQAHVPAQANSNSAFKDLKEGISQVLNNRLIKGLVMMVAVSSFFGIPYIILMPIFARDILHSGIKGLGLLMSANGLGAMFAGLILARLGDFRYKGRLLIFSSMLFSLAIVLFALSKDYILSMLILIFIGGSSVIAISLINTLLQTIIADNYRGRVMSVFMFTFAGMMPFGNLLAGSLTQAIGADFTLMINGILCAALFLAITFRFREMFSC